MIMQDVAPGVAVRDDVGARLEQVNSGAVRIAAICGERLASQAGIRVVAAEGPPSLQRSIVGPSDDSNDLWLTSVSPIRGC